MQILTIALWFGISKHEHSSILEQASLLKNPKIQKRCLMLELHDYESDL